MTWKCPGCGTDIRRTEETPRPGVVYRCHICRLELVLDATSGRLMVAVPPPEAAASGQGA
jgi:rubredoxin